MSDLRKMIAEMDDCGWDGCRLSFFRIFVA